MIDIKVTIQGASDMPPITKIFHYDNDSENIFFNGIESIKNRLEKNLKININEALMVFCYYLTTEIRKKTSISQIQENSKKILRPDQVMIGVGETMKILTFQAQIDGKTKENITFNEPIPVKDFLLIP